MSGTAYIVEVSGEFVVADDEVTHNIDAEQVVADRLGVEPHELDFDARLVDQVSDS